MTASNKQLVNTTETAINALQKVGELDSRYVDGVMSLSDVAWDAWEYGEKIASQTNIDPHTLVAEIVTLAPSDVWSKVQRIVEVRFDEEPSDNVTAQQLMQWAVEETDVIGEFTTICMLLGMIAINSGAVESNGGLN